MAPKRVRHRIFLGLMVKRAFPRWAWVLVVLAGFTFGPGTSTQSCLAQSCTGGGMLVGRVTKGPLPAAGEPYAGPKNLRSAAPAAGIKLFIAETTGQGRKSVVTDRQGEYQLCLPSGTYRITMEPLVSGEFTKDLPATIPITEWQETRLDIRI